MTKNIFYNISFDSLPSLGDYLNTVAYNLVEATAANKHY